MATSRRNLLRRATSQEESFAKRCAPRVCAGSALVERLAQGLGIDHGGFDIAMVGHYPYVFEFNRIFGNQGLSGKQQAVDDAILSYLNQRSDGLDPDNPSKPPRAPLPQVL